MDKILKMVEVKQKIREKELMEAEQEAEEGTVKKAPKKEKKSLE